MESRIEHDPYKAMYKLDVDEEEEESLSDAVKTASLVNSDNRFAMSAPRSLLQGRQDHFLSPSQSTSAKGRALARVTMRELATKNDGVNSDELMLSNDKRLLQEALYTIEKGQVLSELEQRSKPRPKTAPSKQERIHKAEGAIKRSQKRRADSWSVKLLETIASPQPTAIPPPSVSPQSLSQGEGDASSSTLTQMDRAALDLGRMLMKKDASHFTTGQHFFLNRALGGRQGQDCADALFGEGGTFLLFRLLAVYPWLSLTSSLTNSRNLLVLHSLYAPQNDGQKCKL